MNSGILVLCDMEEEYAQLMTEFLKGHRELPWEIHTFTETEEMLRWVREQPAAFLAVSESAYTEEIHNLFPQQTVLLNESGVIRWADVKNINKYQQAENVMKELLEAYAEVADTQLPRLEAAEETALIGIYSPVRRCLQSSFALTLGQMLAESHKTLYLNLEHYAGVAELLPDIQSRDLADLLYFLTAQKEKFHLRMQAMIQKKGNLDYIPPMRAGQNLMTVTAHEWQCLLQKIRESGEYEYIILDMSESIQGLFDLLRQCSKVLTITRDDRIARSKILQYEQVLALYEYEDVLDKTRKCMLPLFRDIPEEIELLTRGELADYTREILREIEETRKPWNIHS